MGPTSPDRRLDGNAAAGPLSELFAIDLTTATATCGHCGGTAALAAHDVYADAPALVVRCRGCTEVVLRFAADARTLRVDLSGARLLVVPRPDATAPALTEPTSSDVTSGT
ncbi:DUF6510 family protein [Cellulomonas sp. 179-A 4D5 NHS]|uniref:DUF6510 family protein n=1 Tax=Cellulomonas sp. 179-A 4D5 NHS TaxID=3142378 RepID=UPI0039A14B11